MLVLSRKVGEQILIADDVVVTVLGVTGTQVKLGIEAPRAVGIVRAEIAATPPKRSALPDQGGSKPRRICASP